MAQQIIVPDGQSGRKLERFLASKYPISYVRKLFRKNGVRLNDRRAKAHDLINPGDRLTLFLSFDFKASRVEGRQIKAVGIDILFENTEFLVINKAAGLAVQEAKNIRKNQTLLGHLESHYRGAGFKPRLVHRLDKDTSGVLLAAKNPDVTRELEGCFEKGMVEKEYVCLVAGRLPRDAGSIDYPLPGRDGRHVRAISRYRVERRYSATTFVRVATGTGRMHQIRLHFAQLGYPLVMDSRHGDFAFNKSFQKCFGLKRQFLHAARLKIYHRGKRYTWSAPLPEDLRKTLDALAAEPGSPFKVQGSKYQG